MKGLYIHIPFCKSKCPYCDFYSYCSKEAQRKEYVEALIDEISTLKRTKEYIPDGFQNIDTLYIGGGTPSVLSGEEIFNIVSEVRENIGINENSEITIECNPSSPIEELIPHLRKSGINRVSLGMQSAVDIERRTLGRTASKERVAEVVSILKENGISNISLDIMLGIPHQTKESLKESIKFAKGCDVTHISAYILKIEEGTYFYNNRDKYAFPNEDAVCDLYEHCVEELEKYGYHQYEISNFAKSGFESKHNTSYWLLNDYLGLGPSAHSFVDGKRFYFDGSTEGFIKGKEPIYDCLGGDVTEYIMLRLRLKSGINLKELAKLYGDKVSAKAKNKVLFLKEKGLLNYENDTVSLTRKGMLLSNAVIAELI